MEKHQILKAKTTAELKEKEAEYLAANPGWELSFRRYFMNEAGQKDELPADGAVSYVVQPVLGEYKVAVWLYLVKDSPVSLVWSTNLCSHAHGSEAQMARILESYEADLVSRGMRIADDCVRTWIYVDDIDHNYAGMVKARRENFEREGMTCDTHYLASTGICGGAVECGCCVQMDALAVRGEFAQRYLYAPDNFNPTHEYGVTFERGVVVEYGGKSHVLISGTASIDNQGCIVHPGDIMAQTYRMLDNVEALLKEASAGWEHVAMMIIYLRDAEDYSEVAPLFAERFPHTPFVITLAPVCRPGWLIEMECMALR